MSLLTRRPVSLSITAAVAAASVAPVFSTPRAASAGALPNGLYVERVGGTNIFGAGTAPSSTKLTALPVFIDTFNAGGGLATPVNTLSFPSSSPPVDNRVLTDIADGTANSGTATPYAVNIMGLSPNGRYLTVLGYTNNAGDNISTSGGTKAIGSVDLATGAASSQIGYANSNVPRGAITQDLSAYWVVGSGGGLQYVTPASPDPNAAASRTTVNTGNGRSIAIFDGQLFAAETATSGHTGSPPGLSTIGTGIPTSSVTGTYFINTGGNPEQFVLLDFTPGVGFAGTSLDTAYVATDNGVEKYTYNGSSWSPAYTLSAGLGGDGGMVGLAYAGKDPLGNPILFGTTHGNAATILSGFSNALVRLVDSGAGSAWSTIATSPANSLFRGVQFGTPAGPGDANGNATIDPDDFALIDTGFARYASGAISANAAGWRDGDFNYDGAITSADYLIIDTAFGLQGGTFSPEFLSTRQSQFGDAYVSTLLASVPEPSSLAASGLALLPLLRRRHSR